MIEKIKSPTEIAEWLERLRTHTKKKAVLCYGHFNVLHPGHVRFLEFARNLGDVLIVATQQQSELAPSKQYFSQEDRSAGVAALAFVDWVMPLQQSIAEVFQTVTPDFYVKGKEFEERQEEIESELLAARNAGAKVVFSSGEVEYALENIFETNLNQAERENYLRFVKQCAKNSISFDKLREVLSSFSEKKILTVGDTIVDQFVACDVLGVSSEAPVMTIRELTDRQYIGGAGIVSRHVRALGAESSFVSLLGEDAVADQVENQLKEEGVKYYCIRDETRPTTFKIRYMVDNQKLLRVSRLKQHPISKKQEEAILDAVADFSEDLDGLIISDFVYGLITPTLLDKLLRLAKERSLLVFGDTQCSSQVGDVSKYKGITLITPTEREARISLSDETSGLEVLASKLLADTGCENVVITLGRRGILAYQRPVSSEEVMSSAYFSALSSNPVDAAGAGDSALVGYALAMCCGLSVFEATVFASAMASIAVERVGNVPVTLQELEQRLMNLQELSRSNA